jgi:hypothetical protein
MTRKIVSYLITAAGITAAGLGLAAPAAAYPVHVTPKPSGTTPWHGGVLNWGPDGGKWTMPPTKAVPNPVPLFKWGPDGVNWFGGSTIPWAQVESNGSCSEISALTGGHATCPGS